MVSLQLGEYPVYKKTERDVRAHPAISHYSHLLLKCRVATNMSHKLKVQSRRFKNYIFAKKCILNQLFGLMNLLLLFLHTLLFCHILLFVCWIFFSIPSGCRNSLDPDQAQHFVGPDLGPNCLQRLSADDKSRP